MLSQITSGIGVYQQTICDHSYNTASASSIITRFAVLLHNIVRDQKANKLSGVQSRGDSPSGDLIRCQQMRKVTNTASVINPGFLDMNLLTTYCCSAHWQDTSPPEGYPPLWAHKSTHLFLSREGEISYRGFQSFYRHSLPGIELRTICVMS